MQGVSPRLEQPHGFRPVFKFEAPFEIALENLKLKRSYRSNANDRGGACAVSISVICFVLFAGILVWFAENTIEDPKVLFSLALRVQKGSDGVEKDLKKALALLKQAAEKGHAGAQCDLGLALQEGRGCLLDPIAALSWYRKSSAQGNTAAMNNIGAVLRAQGGERNLKEGAFAFYCLMP